MNIDCYKADFIRFGGVSALLHIYSQNICETCPHEKGNVHIP